MWKEVSHFDAHPNEETHKNIMELIQHILVFITFLTAVGYLITKFVWKPAFLKKKAPKEKACGMSDCGCSH